VQFATSFAPSLSAIACIRVKVEFILVFGFFTFDAELHLQFIANLKNAALSPLRRGHQGDTSLFPFGVL
jgi:hypothetical protein